MSCTWTTINIYYNKLQKKCFEIHSYGKTIWEKDMHSFFTMNQWDYCKKGHENDIIFENPKKICNPFLQ
jgi:hypothetical protein